MLPLLQRLLQYLPNAEMTLDLEANEVEVKVLTSLASVAESTAMRHEVHTCEVLAHEVHAMRHEVHTYETHSSYLCGSPHRQVDWCPVAVLPWNDAANAARLVLVDV